MRCMCAYMEGVTYGMKQVALLEEEQGVKYFTSAEATLLAEQVAELDDQGRVLEKPTKLHTLPNLRFAFSSFARSQGVPFSLDVGGLEWQSLQKAFQVRHRLMHPKTIKDLDVSDIEMKATNTAGGWFHSMFLGILRQSEMKYRAGSIEPELPTLRPTVA